MPVIKDGPNKMQHQYINRATGNVETERLFKDHVVNFFYSRVRENAGFCFNLIISGRSTALLSYMNFDLTFDRQKKVQRFIQELNIDMSQCLLPPERFFTARQVFERQIKYWECRPLPETGTHDEVIYNEEAMKADKNKITFYDDGERPKENSNAVSPSDSKVIVGTLKPGNPLFIKEKFFRYRELLGKEEWLQKFTDCQFAIFRLSPDEYHYNHTPVSGEIVDFYEIRGQYHSCNPGAVVREVTPYSKNDRVVTLMNTDVRGGSHVGMVAMIEVTAMMIGRIEQCYSNRYYENPRGMEKGMYVRKGQPKSLFRPGSSTVILLFEEGRINFSPDIVCNMSRGDAKSRFSNWFGSPLVETSVRVREEIGHGSIKTRTPY